MIALARPTWLRPAALVGAVAAHATAAWMFVAQPAGHDSPENAIEVTIVAQGDAPEDRLQSALAEAAQQPPAPPAPQPSATPEIRPTPVAALPAPAPTVVAAPTPPPRPVARPETKPPLKPKPAPKAAPPPKAAQDSAPAAAAKRGVESGAGETTAASRASYGSRLSDEIARHKVYPPSARERGVEASVMVKVTVGADGRVVSHSLIRPSGDADIDAEIPAMLAAVVAPPPPDGHFTGSLTIHFDLH